MTVTTENLRQALVRATHRIVTLEDHLKALEISYTTVAEDLFLRVQKLEDQLDVALGKERKTMTEEQIARSLDATSWSADSPTPTSAIDRLNKHIGR